MCKRKDPLNALKTSQGGPPRGRCPLVPSRAVSPPPPFTHPRFTSLASLSASCIHPSARASIPFRSAAQVAVRREEQCIHRAWIWPLWGQVGRRSAESPLAGSTGCGHTTIPISLFLLSPQASSFPPSLSLSFSLLPCLAPSSFVPLHQRSASSLSLSPFPSYALTQFTRSDNNRNSPSPSLRHALSRSHELARVPLSARGFREEARRRIGRDNAYRTRDSTKQAHRRPITMARPS